VSKVSEAAAPYGSQIVFLFLGGFILAIALEAWCLHRRVALRILSFTGAHANGVVLGFMASTALLSMWMSNTATTLMMLPIAASVLALLRGANTQREGELSAGEKAFATSLMLGVAYAANIGGAMTLIGTPPNLVLASFFERELGAPISFLSWLKIGVPFGFVTLTLTYLALTRLLFKSGLGEIEGATEAIKEARCELGAWSVGERRVAIIFALTALAWVFKGQLNTLPGLAHLNDTAVALVGAITLFIVPDGEGGRLLTWSHMQRLPWDIVLLFGGGLSLAVALKDVGVMQAIGDQFGHIGGGSWLGLALLTLVSLSLTEVMSNVALVSVFVPVISAVAIGAGLNPITLCVPVTLAASCAFMLPMSTPPNAIVFASGELKIKHMVSAGLLLNLVAVLWITTLARLILF
jgi:sodium-dependent dicarboxylate transporter 2/3/5